MRFISTSRGSLDAVAEEVGQVMDPSPSEELFVLNLDWFSIGKSGAKS